MNKNLLLALVSVSLLIVLTLLSAIPFGFSVSSQTVQSIPASQVIPIVQEGKGYGPAPGPVVYQILLTNTFMPRQYVLPRPYGCFYNSQNKQGMYSNMRWQVSQLESKISDFSSNENVVQLGRETRTVELTVDQMVRWERTPYPSSPEMTRPVKPTPVVEYPEGFDTLFVWLIDRNTQDFYPECSALQPSDMQMAKRIEIV